MTAMLSDEGIMIKVAVRREVTAESKRNGDCLADGGTVEQRDF